MKPQPQLTDHQKEQLKKSIERVAEKEVEYLLSTGLSSDQIKNAMEVFNEVTKDMAFIYKTPLARRMFILGYCNENRNA